MLFFNINVRTANRQLIFFPRSYQDHVDLFPTNTNRRKYTIECLKDLTFDLYGHNGIIQVLILVVQFVCVYLFYIIIFIAIFLSQTM